MKKEKSLKPTMKPGLKIKSLLLMFCFSVFMSPAYASAADIGKDIYQNGNNRINDTVLTIIKLVGGVGGGIFTLGILIIAVLIMLGSISAAKMRTIWISLISCICGAFLFYSAWYLAPTIAQIAG
ncbi:TrbC/VirB2 family protein [Bacillus sp. UMB0728]|uniref:TrbC/VirB2 family protein n=1 Tax=Bacillus sp. UMB0728 TaxID=2066052 RepID=UPI00215275E5|nr:TrbC/VirB2 family protein [Bacillus sp. UMB0728]